MDQFKKKEKWLEENWQAVVILLKILVWFDPGPF